MAKLAQETVRVGAHPVAFLRHGEGAPLVLLHGAGGNHHAFDGLVAFLGGRQLLVPSFPGRLGSEGPALGTVGALAAWVLAFADAAGLERFELLGHSLGGGVALEAALRPESRGRLVGLTLVSTGARLRVHPALLELARQAAEADQALPMADVAFGEDASEAVREAVAAVWSQTPAAAALADWEAANAFDRMADLGQVAVPARVLVGAGDRMTPEKYARFLSEALPGATLEVHPAAGHMLPWEAPEWLARAVARPLG